MIDGMTAKEAAIYWRGVAEHLSAEIIGYKAKLKQYKSWQCPNCGGVWHKQPAYCPCCGKKVE